MSPSEHTASIKEIQFSSQEFQLNGYLHLPSAPSPPVILGSHGLFSDKDSPKQIALAQRCNQLHMAYFRFDHRGCGDSKAPFEKVTSLQARCADLKAAAKMLTSRSDLGNQIGLFGSSMGGSVCLAVARKLSPLAVVTWGAPLRSTDLVSQTTPPDSGSPAPFEKQPFDLSDQIVGLQNILILHGDADDIVPLSHARQIYDRVSEPKKLHVFARSDHRMSHPPDQQRFINAATIWFQSYLKPQSL